MLKKERKMSWVCPLIHIFRHGWNKCQLLQKNVTILADTWVNCTSSQVIPNSDTNILIFTAKKLPPVQVIAKFNCHVPPSRGQSPCIFNTVWRIQILHTKMSRFEPEPTNNTTKYPYTLVVSWKKWFGGLVTLWDKYFKLVLISIYVYDNKLSA